jgi:benzodiazapine receptor
MIKNKYLSLFFILLITFTASLIGGFTTAFFKEPWYSEIILPSFNPPSWVFAPVWTTLYFMMSIAIWKIWINSFDLKILKLYFIHLFFNGTWSIIFFGFHQIGLALINLVAILIFIIILMKIYLKVDKISFYLMTPYFFWSTYALILNASIFLYNY